MGLTMKIKISPDYPQERFELFTKFFGDSLQTLHKACCFYILELCIRWTRVDTGRLRSGWLPYLAANGFPWNRSMGPVRNPQEVALQEGFSMGRYVESYLNLYVENGVDYAGYLNDSNAGIFDVSGKHSFRPALYGDVQAAGPFFGDQYSKRMNQLFANCDAWLEKTMKTGQVPSDVPTDLGPPEVTD